MPSLDCPHCDGSAYAQENGDAISICTRCDGTGVVFVDEDTADAMSDATG
jgi:DnaJ-class molecular chaperone